MKKKLVSLLRFCLKSMRGWFERWIYSKIPTNMAIPLAPTIQTLFNCWSIFNYLYPSYNIPQVKIHGSGIPFHNSKHSKYRSSSQLHSRRWRFPLACQWGTITQKTLFRYPTNENSVWKVTPLILELQFLSSLSLGRSPWTPCSILFVCGTRTTSSSSYWWFLCARLSRVL